MSKSKKQKRTRRPQLPLARLAYSITEWSELTNTSKPTIYRQMNAGELRFVQVRGVRRIPAAESVRLKFAPAE
jgi:excisionase family DNA binding protein